MEHQENWILSTINITFNMINSAGLSRYLPLFFTYLVFGFTSVIGLAALTVATVGLFSAVAGTVGAAIAATLLMAVLAILLGLVAFLLPAVVVLEQRSLFVAIARAWDLLSGMRGRALGVAMSAYFIVRIPTTGLQFVVGFFPTLGTLAWAAAQAIGYAFLSATAVVLYFDIRCRKEAFDLEHLAQLVEGREPSPLAPRI